MYAAVFGTMSSLFSDGFDPSVRYSAISFVYQFSGIFAAGLTPMVATMLVFGMAASLASICAYLGSFALISRHYRTLWIRHLNRRELSSCFLPGQVKPPFRSFHNRSWKANPPSRAGNGYGNQEERILLRKISPPSPNSTPPQRRGSGQPLPLTNKVRGQR